MMGTLDLSGLRTYKRTAQSMAIKAVQETSEAIQNDAKRLAPIRKVYTGGRAGNAFRATRASRQNFRTLSKTEKMNLGTDIYSHGNYRRFEVGASPLSARGRAELRRGIKSMEKQGIETSIIQIDIRRRSQELFRPLGGVHTFGKTYRLQLGGRLRRDIEARLAEYSNGKVNGGVDSLAPYSRYVEFPTSRTTAQPFLRPALKANRRLLLQRMKAEFRGAEG